MSNSLPDLARLPLRQETRKYIGRTPDHDDKVEEGALNFAYERTAKAWKSRFGVPYSVCGCGLVHSHVGEAVSKFFKNPFKSVSSLVSGANAAPLGMYMKQKHRNGFKPSEPTGT